MTADRAPVSGISWVNQHGLVTSSTTALDGEGTRTTTVYHADGTQDIQIVAGSRELESRRLDALGGQLLKATYTYDAHGRRKLSFSGNLLRVTLL